MFKRDDLLHFYLLARLGNSLCVFTNNGVVIPKYDSEIIFRNSSGFCTCISLCVCLAIIVSSERVLVGLGLKERTKIIYRKLDFGPYVFPDTRSSEIMIVDYRYKYAVINNHNRFRYVLITCYFILCLSIHAYVTFPALCLIKLRLANAFSVL